jgi:hypothetical protein
MTTEWLQPAHLRRLRATVLLLPIKVGRLADAGLPANLRNRNAAVPLLQNERILGVRELGRFHRPPSQEKIAWKTPTLNGPVFGKRITGSRAFLPYKGSCIPSV